MKNLKLKSTDRRGIHTEGYKMGSLSALKYIFRIASWPLILFTVYAKVNDLQPLNYILVSPEPYFFANLAVEMNTAVQSHKSSQQNQTILNIVIKFSVRKSLP